VNVGRAAGAAAARCSVRLRPCATAATAARKIVRDTCAESVRQAHGRIRLLVEVGECAVLVRVEDDSGVLPVAIGEDRAAAGCGLEMVGRVAARSGFVGTSTGRRGWALLARSGSSNRDGLDGATAAVA
jgi:hypothetical protein